MTNSQSTESIIIYNDILYRINSFSTLQERDKVNQTWVDIGPDCKAFSPTDDYIWYLELDGTIKKYDIQGTSWETITAYSGANSITADNGGNVYIVTDFQEDKGGTYIQTLDSLGNWIDIENAPVNPQ